MKKKGFTLIELLAVIIILAVIALIATPVILNVIEKSRDEARKDSVMGYADAVRLSYAEEQLTNTGKPLDELASSKMTGDNVTCTKVVYNKRYGTMLHGCNVEEKGNYCYFRGIVYEGESAECDNVSKIIESGSVPYNPPSITTPTQQPEGTAYAQSKEIKIEFPSLGIVEERYFIKVSEPIEINNVISKCNSGDLPIDCVSSNETTLEPNIWYELSGEAIFTITQNIIIETVIGNEGSFGNKTIYMEDKMDTTEPNVSVSNISTTSDKIIVSVNTEDTESGITKTLYSIDNGVTYQESNVFENLTAGEDYVVKIKVTNGSGMTKEIETETITTKEIVAPTATQTSQTPNNSEYAQQRVIEVTYSSEGIENPEYYLKVTTNVTVNNSDIIASCGSDTNPGACTSTKEVAMVGSIAANDEMTLQAGTWYKTNNSKIQVTFTSNGALFAQTKDATGNKMDASTYTVVNIDTTEPIVDGISISVKTDRATVVANCSDPESGITKYEFSNDNGSTWNSNGTVASYTFTNLAQTKEYTFKVRCTNGSALTKTDSKAATTETITAPTISQTSQTPSSGDYAQQRIIRITYSGANIVNPNYYYSTDGSTWTQLTSGTTKDLTFTSNGKVYAKTTDDAGNTKSASTYTVTNIDTDAPTVSVSVSGKVATITLKDNYAVAGYGVNQSDTTEPTYTTITQTTSTSVTYTATSPGTHYAWVKDASGRTNKVSFTISAGALCEYAAGQTWTLNYSSSEQTFTVPCSGIYKLEVAGGAGGDLRHYTTLTYQYTTSQNKTSTVDKTISTAGTLLSVHADLDMNKSLKITTGAKAASNTYSKAWGTRTVSWLTGNFSNRDGTSPRENDSANIKYTYGGGKTTVTYDGTNIAVAGGGAGSNTYSYLVAYLYDHGTGYNNGMTSWSQEVTTQGSTSYSSGNGTYGGKGYNNGANYYSGSSWINTSLVGNYNSSTNTITSPTISGTNGASWTGSNVTYGSNTGNGYAKITLVYIEP